MNLLKNRAFCVLPFIQEFQGVNGVRMLCCYSNTPIDTINSVETNALRHQILEGNPIPNCQSCYKLEQNKTISPRIRESIRWLRDLEIKSYIENWSPENLQTFFYDIRFDNKCNLACISCGPHSSSLWEKELGQTKSTLSPSLDIDRLLTAKKLYLAGGEPLIIDQFKDLLQAVAAQSVQPEIVINTNLTRVSNEIAQTLGQIKNLTLTVSVDAFEKVNEYHRWPSRWDKFMRNLEWAKEIGCNIHFNSVVDAVTVINIDQLVKIEHMADMWTLSNLIRPPALCVALSHVPGFCLAWTACALRYRTRSCSRWPPSTPSRPTSISLPGRTSIQMSLVWRPTLLLSLSPRGLRIVENVFRASPFVQNTSEAG